MLAFLLSLLTVFMAPTALAEAATEPAGVAGASTTRQAMPWMSGTWRSGGLEMRCAPSAAEMSCREEGKSGPAQGAVAELKFATGGAAPQLTLTLPSIPSSIFVEVAREAQSATYEMKTPTGVARLRFTRTGDELKVERGNAAGWGQALVYRRG